MKRTRSQIRYANSKLGKYTTARREAILRGETWEFTFEEWEPMWFRKWKGRATDGNRMERTDKNGPWSKENCRIRHAKQRRTT